MTFKNKISKTYRIGTKYLAMIEHLKECQGLPITSTSIIEQAISQMYMREFGKPDFNALEIQGTALKGVKETLWIMDGNGGWLRYRLDGAEQTEHKNRSLYSETPDNTTD